MSCTSKWKGKWTFWHYWWVSFSYCGHIIFCINLDESDVEHYLLAYKKAMQIHDFPKSKLDCAIQTQLTTETDEVFSSWVLKTVKTMTFLNMHCWWLCPGFRNSTVKGLKQWLKGISKPILISLQFDFQKLGLRVRSTGWHTCSELEGRRKVG